VEVVTGAAGVLLLVLAIAWMVAPSLRKGIVRFLGAVALLVVGAMLLWSWSGSDQ